MRNPPSPTPGSSDRPDDQPGWQGQQPDWQPPRPGWQAQSPEFHGRREPDNYLGWAIACTALCFLPFGIVSIVYAARVNGLWSDGKYAEAQKASKRAKQWAIAGAIVGPILAAAAAYLVLVVLAVKIEQLPNFGPKTTAPSSVVTPTTVELLPTETP